MQYCPWLYRLRKRRLRSKPARAAVRFVISYSVVFWGGWIMGQSSSADYMATAARDFPSRFTLVEDGSLIEPD